MNDKIEEKAVILPPFKHVIMTIGELPTSYVETMTYYEMLVWFTNYLEKTVIPAINENGEAVIELQELFVKLQTYVNDYFDNLDVQEEINNKLDDMADSGQLTDIIAQYLGLAGMIAFDTVADMKEAENLVNGSKCHTLGFYSVNDGGSAIYKIRTVTNDDVIDEKTIIAVYDDLLVAELVPVNELSVLQVGAKGDNTTDDSGAFQTAFNYAKTKNIGKIIIPNKTYLLENRITLNNFSNITIDNDGILHRKSSSSTEYGFNLSYCDKMIFNNLYFTSERNQTEPAPADHTRQSSSGSNIIGVITHYCNDIIFNNSYFENMASDWFNQSLEDEDDTTLRSNNITFNGWKSRNTSLPMYCSYINNLFINNGDVLPAEEMGSGDHILYCNVNVNNVFVNDCIFKAPDVYFGVLLNFRHSGDGISNDNAPKNLSVNNCIIDTWNVSSQWYNSNIKFENCTINTKRTDGHSPFVLGNGTPELTIDNCKITNVCVFQEVPQELTGAKVIVKNCDISQNSSNAQNNLLDIRGANTKLYIENNNIMDLNSNLMYCSTGAGIDCRINNNNITQSNSVGSYLFTNRKVGTLVFFNGNTVYNTTNKTNVMYNSGTDNSSTYVYNNIIHGYTQLANETDIATINNDYNLIESHS